MGVKNRNTLPFLLYAHFIVLRRLLVLVQAEVEPIANLFYPSSVICMQGGLPDRMCMIENLSKSLHTNDLITLSCIIPITMLLRVFETLLLNILLGLRPLFTPSDFWRRRSQHSQADTDFNATVLELSYWFSIDHILIQGASLVNA